MEVYTSNRKVTNLSSLHVQGFIDRYRGNSNPTYIQSMEHMPDVSQWKQIDHDEFVRQINAGEMCPVWCPTSETNNGSIPYSDWDAVGMLFMPLWSFESTARCRNGSNVLHDTAMPLARNLNVDNDPIITAEIGFVHAISSNLATDDAVGYIPCELVGGIRVGTPNVLPVRVAGSSNPGYDVLVGNFPVNWPSFRSGIKKVLDAKFTEGDVESEVRMEWQQNSTHYLDGVVKGEFDAQADTEGCVSEYYAIGVSYKRWMILPIVDIHETRGIQFHVSHWKAGAQATFPLMFSSAPAPNLQVNTQYLYNTDFRSNGCWGGLNGGDPFTSKLAFQAMAMFEDTLGQTAFQADRWIMYDSQYGDGLTGEAMFGKQPADDTFESDSPYFGATINESQQMVDSEGNALSAQSSIYGLHSIKYSGLTGVLPYHEVFRKAYEEVKEEMIDRLS